MYVALHIICTIITLFLELQTEKNSERFGLKVFLCQEHHTGSCGVHFNRDFDLALKELAQRKFEAEYGDRNEFRSIFGKSYL